MALLIENPSEPFITPPERETISLLRLYIANSLLSRQTHTGIPGSANRHTPAHGRKL